MTPVKITGKQLAQFAALDDTPVVVRNPLGGPDLEVIGFEHKYGLSIRLTVAVPKEAKP